MNKIALFDFCETIANFQTADAFVDYVRQCKNDRKMLCLETIQLFLRRVCIIRVLEKITGYRLSINKRLKLFQLKGICKTEIEKYSYLYYVNKIKPNLIHLILDKLIQLRNEGYSIYLVSGGYNIYLQHFVDEYKLNGLISTRIGFRDGICTGKFDGIDCLNDNKVTLLNRHFKKKPSSSIAYSDSKSDLPFLLWADDGVVVSKSKSQKWAKDNYLKEIIWDSEKN